MCRCGSPSFLFLGYTPVLTNRDVPYFLSLVHVLLGKPVSTFPGHALVPIPTVVGAQPLAPTHLLLQYRVDVWADQRLERVRDLAVLPAAAADPEHRQKALLDVIREQLRLGAVSDTQHVEEALRRQPVHRRVIGGARLLVFRHLAEQERRSDNG